MYDLRTKARRTEVSGTSPVSYRQKEWVHIDTGAGSSIPQPPSIADPDLARDVQVLLTNLVARATRLGIELPEAPWPKIPDQPSSITRDILEAPALPVEWAVAPEEGAHVDLLRLIASALRVHDLTTARQIVGAAIITPVGRVGPGWIAIPTVDTAEEYRISVPVYGTPPKYTETPGFLLPWLLVQAEGVNAYYGIPGFVRFEVRDDIAVAMVEKRSATDSQVIIVLGLNRVLDTADMAETLGSTTPLCKDVYAWPVDPGLIREGFRSVHIHDLEKVECHTSLGLPLPVAAVATLIRHRNTIRPPSVNGGRPARRERGERAPQ